MGKEQIQTDNVDYIKDGLDQTQKDLLDELKTSLNEGNDDEAILNKRASTNKDLSSKLNLFVDKDMQLNTFNALITKVDVTASSASTEELNKLEIAVNALNPKSAEEKTQKKNALGQIKSYLASSQAEVNKETRLANEQKEQEKLAKQESADKIATEEKAKLDDAKQKAIQDKLNNDVNAIITQGNTMIFNMSPSNTVSNSAEGMQIKDNYDRDDIPKYKEKVTILTGMFGEKKSFDKNQADFKEFMDQNQEFMTNNGLKIENSVDNLESLQSRITNFKEIFNMMSMKSDINGINNSLKGFNKQFSDPSSDFNKFKAQVDKVKTEVILDASQFLTAVRLKETKGIPEGKNDIKAGDEYYFADYTKDFTVENGNFVFPASEKTNVVNAFNNLPGEKATNIDVNGSVYKYQVVCGPDRKRINNTNDAKMFAEKAIKLIESQNKKVSGLSTTLTIQSIPGENPKSVDAYKKFLTTETESIKAYISKLNQLDSQRDKWK